MLYISAKTKTAKLSPRGMLRGEGTCVNLPLSLYLNHPNIFSYTPMVGATKTAVFEVRASVAKFSDRETVCMASPAMHQSLDHVITESIHTVDPLKVTTALK